MFAFEALPTQLGEVLGDDLEGLCTAPLTDDEAWDVLLALLEFHAEAQELPAFWTLPQDQRDPWRWAPLEPLCACQD